MAVINMSNMEKKIKKKKRKQQEWKYIVLKKQSGRVLV